MFVRISMVVTLSVLLFTTAGAVHAETVTVAGSGGMIPLLTDLGAAYMKKNPRDKILVSKKSLTQSGGILAAKNGAVDIGMSARNLQVRELNFAIDAYHIADVAAVVAVHSNVGLRNITSQQFCDIYSGKITNWKEIGGHNAPITPFTRPDSDSTKEAFRKGIPCFSNLQETAAALTMYNSPAMLAALQVTPDSIGIIDVIALEEAQGKTHQLKLDGRAASAEELASGRWPLVKSYNLIINKKRKAAVDRFMRFIKSRQGAALIARHIAVPVKFAYP